MGPTDGEYNVKRFYMSKLERRGYCVVMSRSQYNYLFHLIFLPGSSNYKKTHIFEIRVLTFAIRLNRRSAG